MKFVDFGNTKVLVAVLLALLLGAASAAEAARTYSIQSGSWKQESGPTVLPIFPPATVMGTAMGTGTSPATLTIPSFVVVHSQFNLKIPLATFPYVQFTTNFIVNGPVAPGVLAPGTRPSRPANFAFCPGAAANPMCTAVGVGGNQGTKTGIVKYTAATPQFGGTMRMALGGRASFSTIVGSAPLQIAHFGGASPIPGQTGPLILGAPYASNTVAPPLRLARLLQPALCLAAWD